MLIDKGEVTETFDLKLSEDPHFKLFLLNTNKPRKTAQYVKLFLQKCKDEKFDAMLKESLIKANDMCIKSFLSPGYRTFCRKDLEIKSILHQYEVIELLSF